jgi:potassium intermediate/small conductance calcium-activated channel subfamily N protein 2
MQYPNINSYITFESLGDIMCLPNSSILTAISVFRFCFIIKLFKHLTKWNSYLAEVKCEKYSCKANTTFAFKALQKDNPFITLFLIFILTCICFGFSTRIFELYYWESQPILSQDWRYIWNALWCVFVSMTTVGYGDYYPNTHFGRAIVVLACIIGLYFVSMLMVFMTQESILNESEQKAYKLITRLKLRKEIKDIQSYMIYHSLKMGILYKYRKKVMINDKQYEIPYSLHQRNIISRIDELKIKYRIIKTFEFIPTKEQLFDICERIDTDVKEIRHEIDLLRCKINIFFIFSYK